VPYIFKFSSKIKWFQSRVVGWVSFLLDWPLLIIESILMIITTGSLFSAQQAHRPGSIVLCPNPSAALAPAEVGRWPHLSPQAQLWKCWIKKNRVSRVIVRMQWLVIMWLLCSYVCTGETEVPSTELLRRSHAARGWPRFPHTRWFHFYF
jgi:hypothetical protein